jgi:hypothetical protein
VGDQQQEHFATAELGAAFDIAYDTVLATTARRDRLDAAITQMAADSDFTPVVTRLGCLRGIATLTAFALAVEIGDWRLAAADRPIDRRLPRAGAQRVLLRRVATAVADHQDRQHPRPAAAHRGRLAPPPAQPDRAAPPSGRPAPPPVTADSERTDVSTPAGSTSTSAASGPWSPTPPSPVSWPAGAGRWPSSTRTKHTPDLPASMIVSRRWSQSTSFVLAALRALHVDTPHTTRRTSQDPGQDGGQGGRPPDAGEPRPWSVTAASAS